MFNSQSYSVAVRVEHRKCSKLSIMAELQVNCDVSATIRKTHTHKSHITMECIRKGNSRLYYSISMCIALLLRSSVPSSPHYKHIRRVFLWVLHPDADKTAASSVSSERSMCLLTESVNFLPTKLPLRLGLLQTLPLTRLYPLQLMCCHFGGISAITFTGFCQKNKLWTFTLKQILH